MGGHYRALRFGQAAIASFVIALSSCSAEGPKLHPVRGQVLFDDKPAEGATVVFHPANTNPDAPRPSGVATKDGTFTLTTYPHGTGAPEGDYVVLVTWFEAAAAPQKEGRDPPEPKSKLPHRYTDPNFSGLKATVKPGENKLEPFRLSKR